MTGSLALKKEYTLFIGHNNVHRTIPVNILGKYLQSHTRLVVDQMGYPTGFLTRLEFQPVKNRRIQGARVFLIVGEITLARNQVGIPVPIDIGHGHTM